MTLTNYNANLDIDANLGGLNASDYVIPSQKAIKTYIDMQSGVGRNIGEIVTSSLPLSDAGLHLLDGTLLPGGGVYDDFVQFIAELYADNPSANYFTTESDWQASVNTYGTCAKFVYNETAQTVRLPKITGILEGTTDIAALGSLVEAGLPNITGTLTRELRGSDGWATSETNGTGALNGFRTGTYNLGTSSSGMSGNRLTFDASRSNSIYGNSSTVQPQTSKVFVYIVVATTTKTETEVVIDNVMTDLNGKADTDLTNATNSAKSLMASMSMPSNKYVNLTLGASGASYTAPANGWFVIAKIPGVAGATITLINGRTTGSNAQGGNLTTRANGYTAAQTIYAYVPAKKSDVVTVNYTATGNTDAFRFIYAVGSESEFV